jgi:hypothetical protein
MSPSMRLLAFALIAVVAATEFRVNSSAADPALKQQAMAVANEPATVESAFEKHVTLKFKDTPLKDVAGRLSELTGINVLLDSKSLAEASIEPDRPITFESADAELGRSLRAMLAKHDLGYEIPQSNVLLITTSDAAQNHAVVRVYDVADLIPSPSVPSELPEPQPNELGSDIKNLITGCVQPTSWPGNSSSSSVASIEFLDGSLVISHNLEAHREIADLLSALRTARDQAKAGSTASSVLVGSTPAEKKIRERLERREDVDFHELRLSGLLDYLRKQGLPVTVDEQGLADAGGSLDLLLTFTAKQVSLKFALRSMLKEHELGYLIRDGALVVTTDSAVKEYVRFGIYPVTDLLDAKPNDSRNNLDFDSLLDTITSMVSPTSWDSGGGDIMPWTQPAMLIMPQTEEIHEQIADLLAQLRMAHRAATRSATIQKPVEENDPIVVRIYHVANLDKESLDQYISAIRKVIEPDSWQGRYIGKVPEGILVRNTRSSQEKKSLDSSPKSTAKLRPVFKAEARFEFMDGTLIFANQH